MKKISQKAIIIPGTKKSGTATLFKILTKHSMIGTPLFKEPRFFLLSEKKIKKNISWYMKFFPEKKIILDCTPEYFDDPGITKRIKKYFEKEPKIIIIIRDPAKRTYSHYLHFKKKVNQTDTRNYDKIIKQIKGPDFKKIKKTENKNVNKIDKKVEKGFYKKIKNWQNYLSKEKKIKLFPLKFKKTYLKKRKNSMKYFQNSLYSKHIKKWEERFKDVKIVLFEELIKNPEKELKKIYKFLGLKPEKKALDLEHEHKTKIPNNFGRIIKKIAKKYVPINITKTIKKIIPQKILYKPKPKMTREQYNKTRKILKKEYEYWNKKKPKTKKLWKH